MTEEVRSDSTSIEKIFILLIILDRYHRRNLFSRIQLQDIDNGNPSGSPAGLRKTSLGYVKRMTVDNFKSQNRGGKGIKAKFHNRCFLYNTALCDHEKIFILLIILDRYHRRYLFSRIQLR